MLPSKPKSGLSDTSKTPPPANKGTKLSQAGSTRSNAGSPSPQQSSCVLAKSFHSKPAVERRSTKTITTPDRSLRTSKGLDSPTQPNACKEDLKKAKDQLVIVQQEKAQALEQLKDAKRLAVEANEKLKEALVAQKKVEEGSDIANFRAHELEQASAEAPRKREEEWQKETENIKQQHALDVEALRSMSEELEKGRQELALSAEAKNIAMKMAHTNAEKAELLSAEIIKLKSLFDSKLDSENSETSEIIRKLDSEVNALKQELETAKAVEEKLAVMEMLVERLGTEADDAKKAELHSYKLVDDWKTKAEGLEGELMEVKQSLALLAKQFEDKNVPIRAHESEISSLREKVALLELNLGEANKSKESSIEILASLMKQVEEANGSLQDAESETAVYRGKFELLEIQVAEVKKAEQEAVKVADEWKNKSEIIEAQLLELKQHEESTVESLASVSNQLEMSKSETSALRMKVESLEIEVARCKHDPLDTRRFLDVESEEARGLEERKWLMKELEMVRDEEEKAKKAMEGLALALHEVSTEVRETQERLLAKRVEYEDAHSQIEHLRFALKNTEENYEVMLDEARYEIVCLKKSIERFEIEAKMGKTPESVEEVVKEEDEIAEKLMDRLNELLNISHEKKRVDKLSILLTEATTENSEVKGELSNCEKEYDMLPNSKEIHVGCISGENGNKNPYLGKVEPVEVEVRMVEGYKGSENYRNLSIDTGDDEEETLDDDLALKMESSSYDRTNGLPLETTEGGSVSAAKWYPKKKPLLHKFGSLLKKKSNHK